MCYSHNSAPAFHSVARSLVSTFALVLRAVWSVSFWAVLVSIFHPPQSAGITDAHHIHLFMWVPGYQACLTLSPAEPS